MSALTDLFTALANKIRSKTGGSATYTPPQMVNAIDDVYAAGAASVTVTSITPSNTSPVFIEIGSAYKPSKKGYAIESYDNSVTQSAMTNGAYFPSGMVKMPVSGYAYSSQQKRTATGTVTMPSSGTIKVTTGFKPGYVCYWRTGTSSIFSGIYSKDANATKWLRKGSTSGENAYQSFGTSYDLGMVSIDSDGFTLNKGGSGNMQAYYFAIEE